MRRADLIIVGAGLAGSAAAWAAARRGLKVVVLEAFQPGHGNGSSHGSARIFRYAYSDPLYVRMVAQAAALWRKLEETAGETLVTITGEVDFGDVRDPERLHAVLAGCGVAAEVLPAAEAEERWPGFRFPGPVMFHAEAGALDPDAAMTALLRLAAADGAEIHFGKPVTEIRPGPTGGAVVRTGAGEFTAPVALIAAGAWLAPLAGDLVALPELTVTQEQILHLPPRDPSSAWPAFIYEDETTCFYGLPGGRDGGAFKSARGAVKIGEHHAGRRVTADTRDFAIDPGKRQRVLDFAARHLPGLDNSNILNEATCLYTTTASQDFILDRQGPFVIASACSGHGAKFAPLLGEIIADLAQGRPSPSARFTLAEHLARSAERGRRSAR